MTAATLLLATFGLGAGVVEPDHRSWPGPSERSTWLALSARMPVSSATALEFDAGGWEFSGTRGRTRYYYRSHEATGTLLFLLTWGRASAFAGSGLLVAKRQRQRYDGYGPYDGDGLAFGPQATAGLECRITNALGIAAAVRYQLLPWSGERAVKAYGSLRVTP